MSKSVLRPCRCRSLNFRERRERRKQNRHNKDANIGEEEKVEEDMIIADDGEALVAAMAVLFPWT